MSKTVYISSANQFNELLQKSTIVVADCSFIISNYSKGFAADRVFSKSMQIGVALAKR